MRYAANADGDGSAQRALGTTNAEAILFAVAALNAALLCASPARAAQTDFPGPPGSISFGARVAVLSSGNIVVVDPDGPISGVGKVYLYTPSLTPISSFTGSTTNDHVGSGGIVAVGNGNFVVVSPEWHNGSASNAGAVTWVSGTTGLSGVVSPANSLVGSAQDDNLGHYGYGSPVTVLANGNYVVRCVTCNVYAGAATWGSGASGVAGTISAANSLVGTGFDEVGFDIVPLTNGNYVVGSQGWQSNTGAATWGNGATGVSGTISAGNSLIGATQGDSVAEYLTALTNGNYVVSSPHWNGNKGAVTWGNGATGTVGTVGVANSLVGSNAPDLVGGNGAAALANGNYVVRSPAWNGQAGAATWANGTTGLVDVVSESNSLVGSAGDQVGANVAALTNGNYVVASFQWDGSVGAATWGNGSTGITGPILQANSLLGSTTGDYVGFQVIPLTNGNYVVGSPIWNGSIGAATWGNGATGVAGFVSASNSLVGTNANDLLGNNAITALDNGNYVVTSPNWNGNRGAATWGNGATGSSGVVYIGNSLVGSVSNDLVGNDGALALKGGNYLVRSPAWNQQAGAVTWGNGATGSFGTVATANSLAGSAPTDRIGEGAAAAFGDGNFALGSLFWNNGSGAATLASGAFRLRAAIQPWNSVIGMVPNGGGVALNFAYDPARHRLVVGRPAESTISLFTIEQMFAADFEP